MVSYGPMCYMLHQRKRMINVFAIWIWAIDPDGRAVIGEIAGHDMPITEGQDGAGILWKIFQPVKQFPVSVNRVRQAADRELLVPVFPGFFHGVGLRQPQHPQKAMELFHAVKTGDVIAVSLAIIINCDFHILGILQIFQDRHIAAEIFHDFISIRINQPCFPRSRSYSSAPVMASSE